MTALDIEFETIDGAPLSMMEYAGQAVLVVNVASACGFTPQYSELQRLWSEYKDMALVVLGVPCNDFGAQEPGSESEIKSFCETQYGVDFPMTSKVTTHGENAHPFYKWLIEEAGEDAAPKWNFHKVLVDPSGELAGVWPSKVEPYDDDLIASIHKVLGG